MNEIKLLQIKNDLIFNKIKTQNIEFDKKCLEFAENVEKYKYSNGKIYKLYVDGFTEGCYIGSTIKPFSSAYLSNGNDDT